jgi:hypothetical protein
LEREAVGLGQGPMALKRLSQAIASLSADRRRDICIFIAAIIFLSVVYFLARFAEPWLS